MEAGKTLMTGWVLIFYPFTVILLLLVDNPFFTIKKMLFLSKKHIKKPTVKQKLYKI